MKKVYRFLSLAICLNIIYSVSGQTWTHVQTPTIDDLQTISFKDSLTGVCGGLSGGVMIKSINSGNNWFNLFPNCGGNQLVQYVAPQHIYACGGNFMKSTDDGQSFFCLPFPKDSMTENANPIFSFSPSRMIFLDTLRGFVCGLMSGMSGGGTYRQYGQIFRTINGGLTWQKCLRPTFCSCGIPPNYNSQNVYDISFVNSQEGFAISSNAMPGDSLYKTVDGGITWTNYLKFNSSQGISSIHFQNSNIGWATGANGLLLKTINGGNTWSSVPTYTSDNLKKIVFTDSLHGWLIGANHVFRSCDGGTTFLTVDTLGATINDICMLNNHQGYVACNGGNIYKYICSASTTNLTQSICSGQAYSVGSQSFNSTGNYSVTLINNNCGCDSIIQLSLMVHPLPNPIVNYNGSVLTTGSFSSYQWLYNGAVLSGATSQTTTPSFAGSYSVVVSDGNGCSDTSLAFSRDTATNTPCQQTIYDTVHVAVYDTVHIAVTDTLIVNFHITGVNPPNDYATIKVYPNPASDHLYINTGNYANLNGYKIKITNTLNQVVFVSAINQQLYSVDLSNWTGNGTYFISILDPSNNVIEVKKIILQ